MAESDDTGGAPHPSLRRCACKAPMLGLIRRRLRVLRYRRRWSELAAAAANRMDRATALHERNTPAQARVGSRPPPRRHHFFW